MAPQTSMTDKSTADHSPVSEDGSFISSIMKISRTPDITFSEIVWQLQKFGFQTLSIEPIFRQTLVNRFRERIAKFREMYKYPSCPSHWKIDIVFHGTSTENLPTIIQHGFFLPHPFDAEVEGEHCSEHGQKWGPGIYFTRNHRLAAIYGDYECIIMCAVVMGRQFRFKTQYPKGVTGLRRGFDSHVSADGFEGAVFREDQILPLCFLKIKEMKWFEWWETEEYERVDDEDIDEMMREELFRYQRYRRF